MSTEPETLVPTGTKRERIPNAPRGLAVDGRRLWKAVTNACEMRADEEQMLLAACRMLDDIGALETALQSSGVWIKGSKGQEIVNPLYGELRASRLALAKLLRDAGIAEIDEDESDGLAKSSAGRRLAGMRWRPRGMQELFDETA